MIKLLSVPVYPCGGDEIAMGFAAFEHWLKHEHGDCAHESIVECAAVYAASSLTNQGGRE